MKNQYPKITDSPNKRKPLSDQDVKNMTNDIVANLKAKHDLLKIIAYTKVYGLDLYGVKHTSLDCGKGNLESYFCSKLNWSKTKLVKYVRILQAESILQKTIGNAEMKLYSLSLSHKTLMEISDFFN